MKTLVFFNNKGGVGKTTLTCNVVAYLNQNKLARTLLIDADPQCNATQAMLDEEVLDGLYLQKDNQPFWSLFDYLAPLNQGEPTVHTDLKPVGGKQNGYGTDLIPGHPKMSLIEDQLSRAWSDFQSGLIGGYRITNWVSQLLSANANNYDLVVFDVGPSLGALNRTILLSCDYVVTPFGSDIFSLLGIENIHTWIERWSADYTQALKFVEGKNPGATTAFPGIADTSTRFRFAGYSVQQYVMRKFKSGHRPVKAYDDIMKIIPQTVDRTLGRFTAPSIKKPNLELGHIPFLYSLAPLAQSNRVPIHSLRKNGLVTGNQYKQVNDYDHLMKSLCEKLLQNIGLRK